MLTAMVPQIVIVIIFNQDNIQLNKNLLLKVHWNVHFKKKGNRKKKSHVPPHSFLLFNKKGFSLFLRKLKLLQKQLSVYILQPATVLFTNDTKDKSCCPLLSETSPITSLFTELQLNIRTKQKKQLKADSFVNTLKVPLEPPSVQTQRVKPVLLDSVFVKPAEALGEIPAQRDGEDVDEAEESEGVEQHCSVLQEGQSCEGQKRSQIQF